MKTIRPPHDRESGPQLWQWTRTLVTHCGPWRRDGPTAFLAVHGRWVRPVAVENPVAGGRNFSSEATKSSKCRIIAGRHATGPRATDESFDELEPLVTVSSRKLCLRIPRRVRGALALLVLTVYLVGGMLHGLCDLDVTNASGGPVISLVDDGGHSESGVLADHHCHGCFSVSVTARVVDAAGVMPTMKVAAMSDVVRRGLPPGIDPPPPKFPT